MRAKKIDGLILADKPEGLSSAALTAMARRALGGARVGHCGTLDRFASGLMALLCGKATPLAEGLLHSDKVYLATLQFGRSTDTHDPTGQSQAERSPAETARFLEDSAAQVRAAIEALTQLREQRPPDFSALKTGGQRYSDLARRGLATPAVPRPVRVFAADVIEYDPGLGTVRCRFGVGGGCYIRALARDLGESLGFPVHLGALRRTAIGPLSIEHPALWAPANGDPQLLPAYLAVPDWPLLSISAEDCRELSFGRLPESLSTTPLRGDFFALQPGGEIAAWLEGAAEGPRLRRVFVASGAGSAP